MNGQRDPEPAPTPPAPHPVLNAMLICDQTIRDQATGKISLIGIFENINARQFPARDATLTVYANLPDAEGAYQMRLDLIRIRDMMVIGEGTVDAEIEGRMGTAEIIFQLSPVFPEPGRYEFRLYANGRSVGGKSFSVLQLPTSQPPQAPEERHDG